MAPVAPVAPPAPPTMKPVAPAAPPTMAPVAPAAPPAPPTMKPVNGGGSSKGGASSAGGKSGGRAGGAGSGRSEKSDRPARGGGGGSGGGGMGIGGKVGLLAAVVTALVMALAVLPSMKSDTAADPLEAYHAAGANTALGLASGLGGVATPSAPTSSRSPGLAAVETLAAGLESDLKEAGLGGDLRSSVLGALALLKDVGGGRSIQKAVDTQLDGVSEAMKKAGSDPDRMKALRDQKDRYTKIAQLFEGAAPAAPAATAAGAGLPVPSSLPGFNPVAVWWRDATGKVVAQNEGPRAPRADAGRPGGRRELVRRARDERRRDGLRGATWCPRPGSGPARCSWRSRTPRSRPAAAGTSSACSCSSSGRSSSAASPTWSPRPRQAVKDLARELDRLGSSGDPSRRIAAHGPEANAIARSVERMVSNLKFREQHEMTDLAEATAKVQGTAAEIHHGLMPKNPPRIPGWEVETLFKPGFEIGGDHFDYFRIDETHLGVIIMDTSVRGIPAALVMSMARAYVRSSAPGLLSPGELLMRVNRLLAADLSQGQYVTALYAVIDTGNGTAKVASAGHLPLVIYRHGIGKTAVVNPEGIALGLDVGPVFDRSVTEVEVDIGVGDRLVLHTDGALQVQNETGDEYGEARLYDVIKQKAPMNSQAFVNFVGSAIDLFHTTTPQNDDITISTVKRLK